MFETQNPPSLSLKRFAHCLTNALRLSKTICGPTCMMADFITRYGARSAYSILQLKPQFEPAGLFSLLFDIAHTNACLF